MLKNAAKSCWETLTLWAFSSRCWDVNASPLDSLVGCIEVALKKNRFLKRLALPLFIPANQIV
jgi:hypothetical protein